MRQVIKAIDIQVFFGKGESMSIKMIQNIKRELKKGKHQPITIDDFCGYYGTKREEIIPVIEQNEIEKKKIYASRTRKKTGKEELETPKNVTIKNKNESYRFSKNIRYE